MENLPPLTVALPFLAAAFIMAASPILTRRVADLTAIFTTVAVLVMCILISKEVSNRLLVYWFGGWLPVRGTAIGICFAIDRFGIILAGLISILSLAALTFSWHYFKTVGRLYHTLMLVFLGSMIGFCLSGDLFTIFVFFELMSVTAYGLTGYRIEKSSLEGALNFAVTNSIGAFFILMGIGFLYGKTGALNLVQLGTAVSALESHGLITVSFILITAGFLIKGAIVPFHCWLPDAHSVAPTPVSVLFSGVMVELGLYGIARIYWTIFQGALEEHAAAIRTMLLIFSIASILIAGFMCFMQRHIKRLLAFSSISHMGVLLAGIALLTPEGLAGTLIYLTAHGFIKGGLFICTGILLHTQLSVDEVELQAKGSHLYFTGFLFLLGGLGLSGIPFSGLYLGKSVLEHAAAQAGLPWLSIFFLISSMLTAGAVFRVAGRVFLGLGVSKGNIMSESPTIKEKPETGGGHKRSPWVLVSPAAALMFLAVILGFLPDMKEYALSTATQFQDRLSYSEAVLEGSQGNDSTVEWEPRVESRESTVLGFSAVLGSVFLALSALFPNIIPVTFRRLRDRVTAVLYSTLYSLHSGVICDYVAWIVFGISALSLIFFLLIMA
jgi:multicomponent Na+:H+ antiporter subunit D